MSKHIGHTPRTVAPVNRVRLSMRLLCLCETNWVSGSGSIPLSTRTGSTRRISVVVRSTKLAHTEPGITGE